MIDNKPKLGMPNYLTVLVVYNGFFAIAASAFIFAATVDGLPDILRIVLALFGIFSSASTFVIGRKELRDQESMVQLHLKREEQAIEAEKPQDLTPTIGRTIRQVTINHIERDQESQVTREWNAGQEPSKAFILSCFTIAIENKMRVTEENVLSYREHEPPLFPDDDWNERLTLLERVGVLRKADSRPNAVRIWQIEKFPSPNPVLEIFGYAPIEITNPSPTDGNFTKVA